MGRTVDYESFRLWLDTTEDEEDAILAQEWTDNQQQFIHDFFEDVEPEKARR